VALLFNGKHNPNDINTYEKLKALLDSTDFKYGEVKNAIFKDFGQKLIDAKLPLPEDLG
jgi:hypothetical protein